MSIRIFYFFITLFSVSVVFSMLDNPFEIDIDKNNISIANMQANNVQIIELNTSKTYAKYGAQNITRYKEQDIASKFWALYAPDSELHELSADQASLEGNITHLQGNAKYQNKTSGLKYSSNSLIFDKESKILTAPEPFDIEQNTSQMHASSGKYNLTTKKMHANGVQGWTQK